MVTARLLSAADLAALPDDARGELMDGVLTPMTPVIEDHWRIAGRLLGALASYLAANDIGIAGPERGYLLATGPDTVLAPDISFVAHRRNVRDAGESGFARLAPDLAVEIRSPADSGADVRRKVEIYLSAGCPLVWIVDPAARMVAVHGPGREAVVLGEGAVLDGGEILPGFAVAPDSLFA